MEASVVIPFYNSEATLERAIKSVLTQQNVDLQILLIDNNSEDRSYEIARSYADRYEQVTVHKESRQGANNARNLGMLLSQKDWLQYLDADDELLPNKIADQLSIINLDTIDVISSPIMEQSNKGNTIYYEVSELGDIWLSLLYGKIGWTCSNLWRRSALMDVGGWNVDYASHQEVELMSRLIIENKNFYFHNKSDCIVHEQIVSISKSADFPIAGINLMRHLQHYFISNDVLTKERKKAIHTQLYHKYLMAYKSDPKKAKDVMFRTSIDTSIIDLPTVHQILHRILPQQTAFFILRTLGRK